MNKIRFIALFALVMGVFSQPLNAAGGDEYTRGKGIITRVGTGAPSNFNLGVGYRFNPHVDLSVEAFSYSGLTTLTGVVDARYHVLDKAFTPFVDARVGYGILGQTYIYTDYNGFLGSVSAGVSWRRFDLGAGVIYDPFHKFEFTANLSWTYCFRIGRK